MKKKDPLPRTIRQAAGLEPEATGTAGRGRHGMFSCSSLLAGAVATVHCGALWGFSSARITTSTAADA